MRVQNISFENLNNVVELHLKAFPNFFLSSLGYKFLFVFYKSVIKDTNSIAKGVFENEKLLGFAVGTKKSNKFYSRILINNFFSISFCLLPILLKSPKKIYKIVFSFFQYSDHYQNKIKSDHSILLSICVIPFNQSKGVGRILLEKFEYESFLNTEQIVLTTDAINNEPVNYFYLKNGYILLKKFNQNHRIMNCYYKNRVS